MNEVTNLRVQDTGTVIKAFSAVQPLCRKCKQTATGAVIFIGASLLRVLPFILGYNFARQSTCENVLMSNTSAFSQHCGKTAITLRAALCMLRVLTSEVSENQPVYWGLNSYGALCSRKCVFQGLCELGRETTCLNSVVIKNVRP